MKTINKILLVSLCIASFSTGCSKRDKDVVEPISVEDLPQVIYPDDEGDGDLEDADEIEIKLTLLDKIDKSGEELGGTVIPLKNDVTVNFEVTDIKGFSAIADYFVDATAYYEEDDCTTSDDLGIDLNMLFDLATGAGSVTFPAGVEEIILAFEVDPALFDDGMFNADSRGFTFGLTGVQNSANVRANTALEFEYEVQDDEGIFGEWVLDHTDSTQFAHFKGLYGLVNKEIDDLEVSDVDEVILEFGYEELKVLVVLTEEELIEECGSSEMENKEIEVEMEYDELESDAEAGEASFEGEIEFDNGSVDEYAYSGEFSITGSTLTFTQQGEYDDDETEELTITLSK